MFDLTILIKGFNPLFNGNLYQAKKVKTNNMNYYVINGGISIPDKYVTELRKEVKPCNSKN